MWFFGQLKTEELHGASTLSTEDNSGVSTVVAAPSTWQH